MFHLQVRRHGGLVKNNMEMPLVAETYGLRPCRLQFASLTAWSRSRKEFEINQSMCVVTRSKLGGKVDSSGSSVSGYESPVQDGVLSGANLVVALLAAVLTSCPPAFSASLSMDTANTKCTLTGVKANGYVFAYPDSWAREQIRGIEVLVHDPVVTELNMSITTGPAPPNILSGSAEEVGKAIITRYRNSPSINKAELLGIILKQEENNTKNYLIELSVDAGGKQRHFLTKVIRNEKRVLSLTIQVPEDLWIANASCMKSVVQRFHQHMF